MGERALQQQFDQLSRIIQLGVNEKDIEKLHYIVKSYSRILDQLNLQVKVSLQIFSQTCQVCEEIVRVSDIGNSIVLPCTHSICSNKCIRDLVLLYTDNNIENYDKTFCPICMSPLSLKIVQKAFGGKKNFNTLLKDKENQRAPKFECKMCYEENRVDASITLSCDHRFCKKCIEDYFQATLDSANLQEFGIACPECNKSVSINIAKALLSKEKFNRLDDLIFQGLVPKLGKNEVYFKCITENCAFSAIVPKNRRKIFCVACQKTFCVVCRDLFHRKLTCEQNHDAKTDKSLLDLAKELGWKQCPHCKNMCERTRGCNFMKCMSLDCKGTKNFCYLCGKAINGYSHFAAAGPYGEICNTMDGNPD